MPKLATPTPPPAPPAPKDEVTVSDPLTFVPAPLNLNDDDIAAPITPAPVVPPAVPPVVPPVTIIPEDDDTKLTPDARKKRNADLRSQIELANKRAKDLEEERDRIRAEKQAEADRLAKERDDFANKHKDIETRYAELNRSVSMERPELSEEVQTLIAPWNKEMDALAQKISVTNGKGSGAKFKTDLASMIEAARGLRDDSAPDFDQKRTEFNAMVDQFGPANSDAVQRFVFNGIELQEKARGLMRELTTNGETVRHKRESDAFRAIVQDYEKDEASFFNPAPEVKEADPFNAEVLVTELLSGSDDGKKRMGAIKKFARTALLPLPPISPGELEKMTPEDQASFLEGRLNQHRGAQLRLRKLLPTALATMALLPGVMKRNQELEEQVALLRGTTPAPKLDSHGNPTPEPAVPDVKNFTPTNPKLDELKTELRR